MKIEYLVIRGSGKTSYLEEMAKLRLEVFCQWPYLYDGDLEMERKYLKMYKDSADSFWILSKEGDKIIGGITGIPLKDAMGDIRKPFEEKGFEVSHRYY